MTQIPNLEIYRTLVARFFDDKVKGKANPYTSMNGNMYSFLDKTGVVCLRVSKRDRAAFMDAFGTGAVEQYGAVMKEYLALPRELLAEPDALGDAFQASLSYARTLPKK